MQRSRHLLDKLRQRFAPHALPHRRLHQPLHRIVDFRQTPLQVEVQRGAQNGGADGRTHHAGKYRTGGGDAANAVMRRVLHRH